MMKQLVFGLTLIAATVLMAQTDIAAYVWPAYQPEARWAELGIFGKGIGEWQNVQEAVSKWEGHKQPRVPVWGYENEADPKVVAKKIDAAVAAGVNVFIYDWYWYGSRPFLEDGLNEGFLKATRSECGVMTNLPEGCPRLITVNSWNEWTEGSYLEPDTEFGTGYLDAVRRVVRP